MQIHEGNTYRTRNGGTVKAESIREEECYYPVTARVASGDQAGRLVALTRDGRYCDEADEHPLDIVGPYFEIKVGGRYRLENGWVATCELDDGTSYKPLKLVAENGRTIWFDRSGTCGYAVYEIAEEVKLKVKEGVRYRTRSGDVAKVCHDRTGLRRDYPFFGYLESTPEPDPDDLCWTGEGHYWRDGRESPYDLVAELVEAPAPVVGKVKFGVTYRTRSGQTVTICRWDHNDADLPFGGKVEGDDGLTWWDAAGNYNGDDDDDYPLDLVEKVTAVPEPVQEVAPAWHEVADRTFRLEVPGGWLYRHKLSSRLTFVPAPRA